jgi:hypothetical protein
MDVSLTLALACALSGLLILVALAVLSDRIDNFTTALLSLSIAAFVAPFLVTNGFERVWLVVPFAFALVMLPGLLVSILVDAAWRAVTSVRRKRPAARQAQGEWRALRRTA